MEELVIQNSKDQNPRRTTNKFIAFVDTGVRIGYVPLTKKSNSKIKAITLFKEMFLGFKGFCAKRFNQPFIETIKKLVKYSALPMKNNSTTNGHYMREKKVLSSHIVESITHNLIAFESEKQYLSPEVSLQNLASSFGTNRNYLSKVINLEKGKSFPHYINHLRITYSKHELKVNARFRKYTIRAIAEECGFKSAESFSKTFHKTYGIYPSAYLKSLEPLQEEERISV